MFFSFLISLRRLCWETWGWSWIGGLSATFFFLKQAITCCSLGFLTLGTELDWAGPALPEDLPTLGDLADET